MPFIDFTTGQVLTADQMDLVMRQSVMRFADAATRDTALTGVLAEGMIAYLDDTNEVLKYDGTAWVDVNDNDDSIQKSVLAAAGDIIVATAAGTPSALAIGTAGQILESDGTALSYVTPDSSPDDIITTQGDLIIGNATGDASRIAIGAEDTVLTSDGTTATWVASASGGGGQNFFRLETDKFSSINVSFPSNSVIRFALITTSTDSLNISLKDSSDNLVESVSISRDTPFTYFTNATAIAKITVFYELTTQDAILVFSDPSSDVNAPNSSKEALSITSTESVTITKSFDAFLIGGGGGGGGTTRAGAGGGGGSGFFSSGVLAAGTYTATIGAGGAGGEAGGASGGTTEIDAISALGGSGGGQGTGTASSGTGGNGGNGGSGGSGGSVAVDNNIEGVIGGADGSAGSDGLKAGDIGTVGTAGTGSSTSTSTTLLQEFQPVGSGGFNELRTITQIPAGFYAGGGGGFSQSAGGRIGSDATGFGGGGNGAGAHAGSAQAHDGGSGKAGFILLVEV